MKWHAIHEVNPTIKLFVLMASFIFILFVNDLPSVIYYGVVFFILLVTSVKLTLRQWALLATALGLLFISASTGMMFFGQGKTSWFKWGIVHITKESYEHGLFLGIRALVFAFLGLLFALTTKPVLLFYSLMQQLKVRPKYAYSFMAGIRLLPIIATEFVTIQRAIRLRSGKKQGIFVFLRTIHRLSVSLLSQAIRRAYRTAIAMEAKGFSDAKRTYFYIVGFSHTDIFFLCTVMVLFLSWNIFLT